MRAELVRAARLERRVEALSAGVEFPVVPDFCAAVISQLPDRAVDRSVSDRAEGSVVDRRRAGRWGVAAAIVLAAAAAAIAVMPGRRVPIGAPRPALEQISPPISSPAPPPLSALPSPQTPADSAPLTPADSASDRHLTGDRIPLARARHAAGFRALLPPAPAAAYLGRDVRGRRLSLLAGSELITEFRGTTIPYILTLIGPGSHAELTWVNGRPGVYGLAGHTSGSGGVLTWLQGPLTLRIQGAQTLEDALALARSLR